MYLMQIIWEEGLNRDNFFDVYDKVCRHYEDVKLTKLALEEMIRNHGYKRKEDV